MTLGEQIEPNNINFNEGRVTPINDDMPEKPRSRNNLPIATTKNQLLTRNAHKNRP